MKAAEFGSFEAIKQTGESGNEFRFALDLLKTIDIKLEESINSRTLTEEDVNALLENSLKNGFEQYWIGDIFKTTTDHNMLNCTKVVMSTR